MATDNVARGMAGSALGRSYGDVYEGLVATRCRVSTARTTAYKQANSYSGHYARDSISALKIAWANWYHVAGGVSETAVGAATTILASVEYPVGTFTRILWGGVDSATIADGAIGWSDYVSVTIPRGAFFRIWLKTQNSVAILIQDYASNSLLPSGSAPLGDGCVYAASQDGTDYTLTGTAGGAGTVGPRPAAIVGQTRRPSVLILGDSRALGSAEDSTTDEDPDVGSVERWIGPSYAYTNVSQGGATVGTAVATSGANIAKRLLLLPYCSDVVISLGYNDVANMVGVGAILTNLGTLSGWLRSGGKRVWLTTAFPGTTSTDNWATAGNQTPMGGAATPATAEANRVKLNKFLRHGRSGLPNAGCVDVSCYLEDGVDTGLLPTTGVANATTNDGVHLLGDTYRTAGRYISPLFAGMAGELAPPALASG